MNDIACSQTSQKHIKSINVPTSKLGKCKRKKAWATKVKSGCSTCRIRRVKCDEAKPACTRCTSTGRKCDGYTTIPQSSMSYESFKSMSPWHQTPASQLQCALMWPEGAKPAPESMQAAHFFRSRTVIHVCSVFDQPLWNLELPRATLMHPTIWYATNSFAAMHQRYSISDTKSPAKLLREKLYNHSLRQYNSSIKYLLEIANQKQPNLMEQEVVLITSVLFTGICSLKGDIQEALIHACNGLSLFHKWGSWKRASSNLVAPQSLIGVFCRLDSQVRSLGKPSPQAEWRWQDAAANKISTTPFVSVTEAYLELELLLNGLMELMQARKLVFTTVQQRPIPETRLKYRHLFDVWRAKFSNLRRGGVKVNAEAEAILILQIREKVVDIALQIDLSQPELCWDIFQPQFEQIIQLSQQLLDHRMSQPDNRSQIQGNPTFQLTASLCEPLYQVAVSCRTYNTRRKAVALLQQWPLTEGLWNPVLAAKTIQHVILYEEQKSSLRSDYISKIPYCECVPKNYVCLAHRVLDTHLNFINESTAELTLTTVDDVNHGRTGQTTLVEW